MIVTQTDRQKDRERQKDKWKTTFVAAFCVYCIIASLMLLFLQKDKTTERQKERTTERQKNREEDRKTQSKKQKDRKTNRKQHFFNCVFNVVVSSFYLLLNAAVKNVKSKGPIVCIEMVDNLFTFFEELEVKEVR
jgi:hypothetical protein